MPVWRLDSLSYIPCLLHHGYFEKLSYHKVASAALNRPLYSHNLQSNDKTWIASSLFYNFFFPCTWSYTYFLLIINTLRPRQNGRLFADDIFKCIFLDENVWISIKISLKFVQKCPINDILALIYIIAWCRPSSKSLSDPMMVSLLTHICIIQPEWVYTRLSLLHNDNFITLSWWEHILGPGGFDIKMLS